MELQFEKFVKTDLLNMRLKYKFSKYTQLIDESGTIKKIMNIFSEIKKEILSKEYTTDLIQELLCDYSPRLFNLIFPEFEGFEDLGFSGTYSCNCYSVFDDKVENKLFELFELSD